LSVRQNLTIPFGVSQYHFSKTSPKNWGLFTTLSLTRLIKYCTIYFLLLLIWIDVLSDSNLKKSEFEIRGMDNKTGY
jgi:hypothetical protein